MAFVLDERLEKSTYFVADMSVCSLLLKEDKSVPWVVLVPQREGIREIFDLSPEDRALLIEDMAVAGEMLKTLYKAEKINTAAYGNMVPQLHIHIFARYTDDRAWPQPLWVVDAPKISYTEDEKETEISKIRSYLEGVRK